MLGKENPNGFKSGKINWLNKLISKEMNIIPALEIPTLKLHNNMKTGYGNLQSRVYYL